MEIFTLLTMNADVTESLTFLCSLVGSMISGITAVKTYRRIQELRANKVNGLVLFEGRRRLRRHVLNVLAQLVLFYASTIAVMSAPVTVNVQSATKSIAIGSVALILCAKAIIDRWEARVIEQWDGADRRHSK